MWGLDMIARHPLAADFILTELEAYQKGSEQWTCWDVRRMKKRIREHIAREC
jgi:hypothetical protein